MNILGNSNNKRREKKPSDTDRNFSQDSKKVHHKFYSHLHFKLDNFSGYTQTHEETGY